ncbi:winged helix-turn-helix transcriptional regulator [bacterium]|nr:winged helix-turn-helix transcriptional regulator [bacterium]
MLKALAHPVRMQIVEIISGLTEDNCSVTAIQKILGLPQSTVSQHLQILRDRGIISGERRCVETCYRIVDDRIKRIMEILK